MEGYQRKLGLITLWSAPNFCGKYGNLGCAINVLDDTHGFNLFRAAPEHDRAVCQTFVQPGRQMDRYFQSNR